MRYNDCAPHLTALVLLSVSSSLLSFGRVRFEGRVGQVGVEGPLPAECFVGSDRVVCVGEGGDVLGEVDSVGDVLAVEALVFEGLEPALDDAVGVRGSVPGPHVGEVGRAASGSVAVCVAVTGQARTSLET